jgi:hypothetical protein
MTATPDDLDKLLCDVKKCMEENRLFLKTLADDTTNRDETEAEEMEETTESFEEL